MEKIIGIRREDKNEWERRVPLVPDDVRWLREKHGIRTLIQPSAIRIFADEEYRRAGAEVGEDLGRAGTVFAVKEIPETLFQEGKTYVFFSHTIKGQHHNLPMLKAMVERRCSLVDYERVLDEKNRRLIFFGRYAGLAGMLDTLHGYGVKLETRGIANPFSAIRQAYQYASLEEAKAAVEAVGAAIDAEGFPEELCPLVVGFAGYGNVSRGAQEIFDLLPHKILSAEALVEMIDNFSSDNLNLVKVVFSEDDMVRPRQGRFELQDYYAHPEKYEGKFEDYLPLLSILVNCIYWTDKYPRLVTKEYLRNRTILESTPRLQVIGDISCDIDGSIEITHKATKPDNPFYTYFAGEDRSVDGVQALGTTVMAVDNLPCEFPRESSNEFSAVLRGFVPALVAADFDRPTAALGLPYPIQKALLLHRGAFAPEYEYMRNFVK
ncbi:MAG: bifunctional lysine ketoglutarate reductase /saccharopine dehydrogenase family protein [Acidobacteria bacterium]|jgi:alpha-aminoadipic semialdehyde synthase|nr:bifunctional lysine ketoglutarate reductase /saccharopine dehydrogenase family protein [Acidobacteriota bacterium]